MKRTAIIALFAAFALLATPLWTTGARAEILDDTGTVEITAEKIHLNIVFIGSYDADGQEIVECVLVTIFGDDGILIGSFSVGTASVGTALVPMNFEDPTVPYIAIEKKEMGGGDGTIIFGLYGVEDFLSDGIIHLDLLESGGWMKIMKSVGYRDDMMKDYDGGDGILAEKNREIHSIVLVDGLRSNLYPFTIQGDGGTPIIEWAFEQGWPCRYEGPRLNTLPGEGGDTIYAAPSSSEVHGLEFADYILVIITPLRDGGRLELEWSENDFETYGMSWWGKCHNVYPGLVSLTGGIPFPGITSVAGGIPFPGLVSALGTGQGDVPLKLPGPAQFSMIQGEDGFVTILVHSNSELLNFDDPTIPYVNNLTTVWLLVYGENYRPYQW